MRSLTRQCLIIIVVVLAAGCGPAQETAREKMALGWMSRQMLDEPAYHFFDEAHDTSSIDTDIVNLLSTLNKEVDVLVFLGTWCSDSRREVPSFYRVVDAIGFPQDRIRLYGLDRTKKSADGMTDRYAIERVPTFIFLKHEMEVGRITERPHTSIEADMLAIFAKAQGK